MEHKACQRSAVTKRQESDNQLENKILRWLFIVIKETVGGDVCSRMSARV